MIDTTGLNPSKARETACVIELAVQLRKEICDELSAYIKARDNNEPTPTSPLQQLKVECIARLVLMADFHKTGIETEIGHNPRGAIAWAIDHETIKRILRDLSDIDCQPSAAEQGA